VLEQTAETIALAPGKRHVDSHWLAPFPAQRSPRNQLASPEANPWRPQAPVRTHGHRLIPARINQGGHGHG